MPQDASDRSTGIQPILEFCVRLTQWPYNVLMVVLQGSVVIGCCSCNESEGQPTNGETVHAHEISRRR